MTNTELIKSQQSEDVNGNMIFEHIRTGDKFTCALPTNDGRVRLYSIADDTGNGDIYVSEDCFNDEFKRIK